MKKLLGFILVGLAFSGLYAQTSFDEKFTDRGNIGLTVTNIGVIGNAFDGSFNIEGFPSCEYPIGSGNEHLFDAGIWVGGVINGSQVAVSTAAVDATTGYTTGRSGFEFTAPLGSTLQERSSLTSSPLYQPAAISHQDFIADFTDANVIIPGSQIPIDEHDNPMGIDVHMETYNWNFSFANFFVILNYRITNSGTNSLDSLYVGYWADPVVRNINVSPPGTPGFFTQGGNGYIDSLQLAYEFDANSPDTIFSPTYFAVKFLGSEDKTGFRHPKLGPDFNDHYSTWQFQSSDPFYFTPVNDAQKYDKMTQGLNNFDGSTGTKDWEDDIIPEIRIPSNRTQVLSVGPFVTLEPGESIDIAFAVICAFRNDDGTPMGADSDEAKSFLIQNAGWAQTAYLGEDANCNGILDPDEDNDGDGVIDRFILPTPPDVPEIRIVPGDQTVDVYWTRNSEFSVDPISNEMDFEGWRIYKTQIGFDQDSISSLENELELVAEFDYDGNNLFFDTGLDAVRLSDPVTFEGDTNEYYYRYTFDNIQNGWQHAIAVTAFDRGDNINNVISLESAPLANVQRVFPGKRPNENLENDPPFAYPNPYYAGADWEGSSGLEEDRRLIFANLPAHCMVRIYSVAGDLIDQFEHTSDYSGLDTRWYGTNSDPERTNFSGGEHSWDLLSKDNQIIARGIYLFSVEDLETGEAYEGKFVIIK